MPDTPQRRRLVSPAVLLAVVLCFFLPFFSVSCSAGMGQMTATVTGMDQVVGGEPEYSGFRPPSNAAGQSSPVSPPAVVALLAVVAGIGAGLGLSRAKARSTAGAAAGGVALVAVVANQVLLHDRAQETLGGTTASLRSGAGSGSLFGSSFSSPVLELHDEPGFWMVTVLLAVAVAYNVHELVVLRRDRSVPAGAAQPPPNLPPSRS